GALLRWEIHRGVRDTGCPECLATLDARAASTTMDRPTFVARPGALERDAQVGPDPHDVRLGDIYEGCEQLDRAPVAQASDVADSFDELGAAVGVDGVVAGVGGVCDRVILEADRPADGRG